MAKQETKVPKEPKIPFAKSTKALFRRRYQELYLTEAPKGIPDEDLLSAVHSKDYPELTKKKEVEEIKEEEVQLEESNKEEPEVDEAELIKWRREFFDTFGVKPDEKHDVEYIKNKILAKKKKIEEANKPKQKETSSEVLDAELKDDEVLALNVKTGEIRIFKKGTLTLLNDWSETAVKPKELK